MTGTESRKTLE